MPQKTRARKDARRVGQSAAAGRKKGLPAIRRSRQEKTPAAAVLADSIHSLKLAPIPTPDVSRKMQEAFPDFQKHSSCEKYEAILKDLWLCYRAAMWKFHRKKISISETNLMEKNSVGLAIQKVLKQFEKDILPCFPEGCYYNIDKDNQHDGYCISVFKVCSWPSSFCGLELVRLIKHLRKNRRYALHKLFLSFIRSFWKATGIGSYWGGNMEMSEEWLDDKLEQALNDVPDPTDKEDFKENQRWITEMQQTLFSYRYGEAAEYASKITSSPILTPDEFRVRLKRIRRDHPVKRIIEAGCHYLLEAPYSIEDFVYGEQVYDDAEGLRFDQQALFVWEWDDPWTVEHTDYIDSMVNDAGYMDPVASYRIDWRFKKWTSMEHFTNSLSWPSALGNFFELANSLIKPIYNEPTHRIRVR